MRLRNNIIFVFLIFALTFQSITLPEVSAESLSNSEAVRVLSALGIIKPVTDSRIQMIDTLKRRELAEILANVITGGNPIETEIFEAFSDVMFDDPSAESIEIAVKNGILSGNGNGTFLPEMAVRFEEAVKSIICLLGYGKLAEANGGYPSGYLSIATTKGLLKNTDGSIGDFITIEAFTQMLYNALDVPMFTITRYGTVFDEYTVKYDATILSEMFHIKKDKGIIEANSFTSLEEAVTLQLGMVKINETIFEEGQTDAGKYLGYYVTYYYKYNTPSDTNQLICIEVSDSKNQVITINAEDINDLILFAGSRKMELSYQDKATDKERNASIGSDVNVIYNRKAFLSYQVKDLVPEMGSVTLIDNNCDDSYEVMKIEACQTVLVNQISTHFGWVTDQYKKDEDGLDYKVDLDSGSGDYDIFIQKDGKDITLKEIKPWDVLSIYASKNNGKKIVEVKVIRNSISGSVSETNEDYIVINGNQYPLSVSYKKYLKEYGKTIPINTNITLYLNDKNQIVGMEEIKFNGIYAYMRTAALKNNVSKEVQFRVWNIENDEWKTLSCARKVLVNGEPCSNDILASMRRQLIRYKLNSKDEISQIYVLSSIYESATSLMYNYYINAVGENSGNGTHYYINSRTKKITIPQDEKDFDNEKMYLMDVGMVHQVNYSLMIYDIQNYVAGVIIYESSNVRAGLADTQPSTIVTKLTSTIDEDGTPVAKIYGICEGNNVEYTLTPEVMNSVGYKSPGLGDFIRLITNVKGYVTTIAIDYSAASNKLEGGGISSGGTHTGMHMLVGSVNMVDTKEGIIVIDAGGIKYPRRIPTSIVINHNNGKRFVKADAGDIDVGQMVVYRSRDCIGRTLEIFVQED